MMTNEIFEFFGSSIDDMGYIRRSTPDIVDYGIYKGFTLMKLL
jgi:hypothetical protein